MTTRRTGKNRKPHRRPAALPAARPVDSIKPGEISSVPTPSATPPVADPVAIGPTAAAEPVATVEPVTPPGAEAASDGPGAAESETAATEGSAEQASSEGQAEATLAATAAEASPADDAAVEAALSALPGEAENHHALEETAPETVARDAVREAVHEPVQDLVAETVAPADVAEEPVGAEPAAAAIDPAAVATAGDRAPTPTEATPEMPERPAAADRGEIPLAAMQSLIEINGRLVAFMQGEGQAAVAFWKAAVTVRSPGDLTQLQVDEVSRAFDAALACWTDVARRMGRFTAFASARAA